MFFLLTILTRNLNHNLKNDMNISVWYLEMITLIMHLTQCPTLLYYMESITPALCRNEINDISMLKYKGINMSTGMSYRYLMFLFQTAFQLVYTNHKLIYFLRKKR